jgi:hypothetical protein
MKKSLFAIASLLLIPAAGMASEPGQGVDSNDPPSRVVDRNPNDPPQRTAPTIRLDSFIATRAYRQTGGPGSAELCGTIRSSAHLYGAQVVTDYQTRSTSNYRVMANEQGKFCVMVMTFTGRVRATVWEHGPDQGEDDGSRVEAAATAELMLQ